MNIIRASIRHLRASSVVSGQFLGKLQTKGLRRDGSGFIVDSNTGRLRFFHDKDWNHEIDKRRALKDRVLIEFDLVEDPDSDKGLKKAVNFSLHEANFNSYGRFTGVISDLRWAFGFVITNGDNEEVFFHRAEWEPKLKPEKALELGLEVQYDVVDDIDQITGENKGLKAINIRLRHDGWIYSREGSRVQYNGVIKFVKEKYGFIHCTDLGEDIIFRMEDWNQVFNGQKARRDQHVKFTCAPDVSNNGQRRDRGLRKAVDFEIVEVKKPQTDREYTGVVHSAQKLLDKNKDYRLHYAFLRSPDLTDVIPCFLADWKPQTIRPRDAQELNHEVTFEIRKNKSGKVRAINVQLKDQNAGPAKYTGQMDVKARKKDFGFIICKDLPSSIYFNFKDWQLDSTPHAMHKEMVTFELVFDFDEDGKFIGEKAVNIKPSADGPVEQFWEDFIGEEPRRPQKKEKETAAVNYHKGIVSEIVKDDVTGEHYGFIECEDLDHEMLFIFKDWKSRTMAPHEASDGALEIAFEVSPDGKRALNIELAEERALRKISKV